MADDNKKPEDTIIVQVYDPIKGNTTDKVAVHEYLKNHPDLQNDKNIAGTEQHSVPITITKDDIQKYVGSLSKEDARDLAMQINNTASKKTALNNLFDDVANDKSEKIANKAPVAAQETKQENKKTFGEAIGEAIAPFLIAMTIANAEEKMSQKAAAGLAYGFVGNSEKKAELTTEEKQKISSLEKKYANIEGGKGRATLEVLADRITPKETAENRKYLRKSVTERMQNTGKTDKEISDELQKMDKAPDHAVNVTAFSMKIINGEILLSSSKSSKIENDPPPKVSARDSSKVATDKKQDEPYQTPEKITIVKGKTLDQISRGLLRDATGETPSEKKVIELSNMLAKENNILNKNLVKADTDLKITGAAGIQLANMAQQRVSETAKV